MPSGRRLARLLLLVAASVVLAVLLAGNPVAAAIGNAAVAARFGLTLLPGREPLISHYSRFDAAGQPEGGYTRALTLAWALLLGGFALGHAVVALAGWKDAGLAVAEPVVCLLVFCGEHALRNRRFPQLGRATPLRTLRAIGLAHGLVRHAA
ncbi:hypothetical protein [Belnapia rosea]|uniref:Uncharacterized protein n=1 Tax=Belnapia rosea TaxID=938405 RepID=A0A1G6QPS5_9PROT|nr:hypothetical protein [Belnapia rosea]SDC94251.1 hypothetical protein SAMN04487779_1003131 [Belnapia rosea]